MYESELAQLLIDTRDGVEYEHMDRLIRIANTLGIDIEHYEYYYQRWGVSTLLFMELFQKCNETRSTF